MLGERHSIDGFEMSLLRKIVDERDVDNITALLI